MSTRLCSGVCSIVVTVITAGCGTVVSKPAGSSSLAVPALAASPTAAGARVWYLRGTDGALYSTDWTGQTSAGFAMPPAPPTMSQYPGKPPPTRLFVMSASPDGSRLLLNDGSIRHPRGLAVEQIDMAAGLSPTWADDNRHLCQMTTPDYGSFTGGELDGAAILRWLTPGGGSRQVVAAGAFGPSSTVSVLACSAKSGLAVLAEKTASGVTQAAKAGLDPVTKLVVVRIADGATLYERDYPVTTSPLGGTMVTASSDGRFIAEVYTVARHGPTGRVTFRSLPDGAVQATWTPTKVQSFSADGSLAFIGGGDFASAAQIVNWRTGQVVRREAGGPIVMAGNPSASAFVAIERSTTSTVAINDLWVIPASGPSVRVDTDILEVITSAL